MSLECTKEEMEKRRELCLENISEDECRAITKCEDCPLYDGCSEYGEELWTEATEKARLPNGRFGKLYKEGLKQTKCQH